VEKVIAHADRMAIIHQGQLRVAGSPDEVVSQLLQFGVRPPCYSFSVGKGSHGSTTDPSLFPGESLLHRWDARCKFLGLLAVGVTLLEARGVWLVLDSGLLLGLLTLSRLPLRSFLRDLRTWAILLFALFLFQLGSLRHPAIRDTVAPRNGRRIAMGRTDVLAPGLILGYAVLFTAVTRPRELQDAIIWLLRPVRSSPSAGWASWFPLRSVFLDHS